MKLQNGIYRTAHGSVVEVSGKNGGRAVCEFDWLEEPNACCDCKVDPHPQWDVSRWILTWECEHCGGGCAELVFGAEGSAASGGFEVAA